MNYFAFIALHAISWPVRHQCRRLGVSPSGYYAWRKQALPELAQAPAIPWQLAAQRVFTAHAHRYGQRRLRAQLRREGHIVGRQRLRGWRSASGLRARCTRTGTRPPRTTQADPQAVAAAKQARYPAGGHGPEPGVGGRQPLPGSGHGPVGVPGPLARRFLPARGGHGAAGATLSTGASRCTPT